ncbi:MAG: PepSY-associated TM helix domain-containing protein [Bacteroidota bacterium]
MGKDRRSYNVFFNLHTVSGIAITIGLFVIFLAGAFALFRSEINNWQYNEPNRPYRTVIDYDKVLKQVEQQGHNTKGGTFSIFYRKTGDYVNVKATLNKENDSITSIDKAMDTKNTQSISMRLHPNSYTQLDQSDQPQEFLGNYINELHFFNQIPGAGKFLAGLVGLFFGLAIISGVIVHWKKIIPNFFTFRIKSSVKNLWTDAHVALGILGLPFQLMYAITGAFLGVFGLFFLAVFFIQYGGDSQKLENTLYPDLANLGREDYLGPTHGLDSISINRLIHSDLKSLDPDEISFILVNILDYQEKQGELTLQIEYTGESQFITKAYKKIRIADGLLLHKRSIDDYGYGELTGTVMDKLHDGNFGGFFIKITYFVLSLITCYVILSGVLIWLVAREKKSYSSKAKFNRNVGAVFIGSCMGLFPAIALFFCLVKLFPKRFGVMSSIFLLFWLAYTIYSYFIKSPFKINKHALFLAGGLGLLIPVLNGIQSGLWFWKSLVMGYPDAFFVDVGWLFLGSISLFSAVAAKKLDSKKSKQKPEEKIPVKLVRAKS